MKRLRVGVIGVGHLGRHHARVLAGIGGVELVGVADARIEQAQSVAAPLGTRAFDDYHELLGLGLDAVSVAVPTSLHRAVAGACLDRGLPTLVEKPLAATLPEAEELVALARRRGVLLQVGHIERFNPALAALKAQRLRPKFIAAERLGTYTFRSTDIGVVHDLMIHDIDLLLSLVEAPVRSVTAVGVSLFGRHEDVANARITFEDGCVAELTASRASFNALRKMRVWSPEGYATLDFAARSATVVRPSDRLRQGQLDLDGLDLSQPASIKAHLFGKVFRVDHVPPPEACDQLTLELEDFVGAIREGRAPRVTGDDALRAMQLADRVRTSLDLHPWDGHPDGPIGPRGERPEAPAPIANLPAPKSWRYRPGRRVSNPLPPGEGGGAAAG
jgi:predicted dehydrogenase